MSVTLATHVQEQDPSEGQQLAEQLRRLQEKAWAKAAAKRFARFSV